MPNDLAYLVGLWSGSPSQFMHPNPNPNLKQILVAKNEILVAKNESRMIWLTLLVCDPAHPPSLYTLTLTLTLNKS